MQEIINLRRQYNSSYAKFSESKMDFKIKYDGIEFIYNFDFPHVGKVDEPSGNIFLSFGQLRNYLSPTGLLVDEIK